jgi:hypothetical protein
MSNFLKADTKMQPRFFFPSRINYINVIMKERKLDPKVRRVAQVCD